MHERDSSAPRLSRRTFVAAAAGAVALPQAAMAQQNVSRILVPFPPGGPADYMGRLLAEKMKDAMGGRTLLVDNRPGAGTRLATEVLKNSPADGTVALLTPVDPMFIAPLIYSNLRYDPQADFKALTDVAGVQFGLVVNASSPIRNVADLVKAAKASAKDYPIAISSLGTLLHFLAAEFVAQARIDSTIAPYRGGAAIVTELLGNQIAAGMDATTSFVEHHRAGKLRVIAVAGEKRADALPDVPTFAEQGFPSLVASSRYLLYVRANTSAESQAQWAQATRQALAMPDVREKLARAGYDLVAGASAQEVAKYASDLAARWTPVIKASGFKGE
ncbi:tripartite tricarboxylate transporter substrate-binding protein [Variovorax soli]|uniref:tripartite tricarboxylate transporter substrate-binding protein n=1 Tax=Variovorax soli TaxID=376815 RepID=UPI0008388284|nr:tripartite tricarboxylate transporter substrate-binding protein [Variovorax soli]